MNWLNKLKQKTIEMASKTRTLFNDLGWPLKADTPELASWNSLSKSSTATKAETEIKVGLFSFDVIAFLEGCVTA